jgi:thiol-disulfide isomerase/thioredoxin
MTLPKAVIFSFFILIPAGLFSKGQLKIKNGKWTAHLHLREKTILPFLLIVEGKGKNTKLSVVNGTETIVLEKGVVNGDSVMFEFPAFNSRLTLITKGNKNLKGYWINLNKTNYRIPFTAVYGYQQRFSVQSSTLSIKKKWEITFDPDSDSPYKSVGLFEQNGNRVEGTFLTETGDYRFLEGNVSNDSLYLSCFDGSHAFLFTSRIVNDSIYGDFYSGKHWKGNWNGRVNSSFELKHPDSLTYTVNEAPFTFTLKDLKGNDFTFPQSRFENKVTIIQIMGTWCPNCMDETQYFKKLYDQYHASGLEIISVGYEVGKDFTEHAEKIRRLQEKYNLPFTFLVGGNANKGLASEHFSMLNKIISFPTAIFIGRDGTVKKIHTGFNGPGTGTYYEEYIRETELFIQSLLKEQ